tara:strand:- start:548 stop:721 length:174 start_codon:yes stop_codon:yes gene_type:complete
VVAMQVADENMIDFGGLYFVFLELKLGALSAIDEKVLVINHQYLRRLVSVVRWSGGI